MNELHALEAVAESPGWWELVRALWPVFLVIASLAIGGIVLALKSMFATRDAHRDHGERLVVVETFVIEQKTALGILPTRQQLGDQIARQGDKIVETKDEITEQLSEFGERIASLESAMRGNSDTIKTTNTYLHMMLERGLKP